MEERGVKEAMQPNDWLDRDMAVRAVEILVSDEFDCWSDFETEDSTDEREMAIGVLVRVGLFQARTNGTAFGSDGRRVNFKTKVWGAWQEAMERELRARSVAHVKMHQFGQIRKRNVGVAAAKDCQTKEGLVAVMGFLIDNHARGTPATIIVEEWEHPEATGPQNVAAAQAIASPEINVNISVPSSSQPSPREPNRELEKPGGKYHEDLMRCVHKHQCATPIVKWDQMPDAVSNEGFHRHAKGNLNKWYNTWRRNQPTV